MKSNIFKLTCVTNMHVGNGDINFSVIDNEVEKDVNTGYPMIHSSGVKGALREFLKGHENEVNFFGSKANGSDGMEQNVKSSQQGQLKFLSAHMIARPMRVSNGNEPYILVATQEMLKQARELLENLGKNFEKKLNDKEGSDGKEGLNVEGYNVRKPNTWEEEVLKIFALENSVSIMKNEDFQNVALPVLARNCLENGKSVNLWYEEIVPYKSVFFFCVLENKQGTETYLEKFEQAVNGKLIQFGGNATIGYGLSKVEKKLELEV